MHSFNQVVVFLFALFACALAQSSETDAYDATVYVTSTIYRVNTVTMSGSPSASVVANSTTTISPSYAPSYPASSGKFNGTSIVMPSGTGAKPSSPQFTGAASALNVNAYVAALAAGVGYLVL